jgi:hypothetical protein
MLKRHRDGVLRYARHAITNGVAEGLNSKIMTIKRKAGGFRNPSHFTTAIYFHCGGLDLRWEGTPAQQADGPNLPLAREAPAQGPLGRWRRRFDTSLDSSPYDWQYDGVFSQPPARRFEWSLLPR